MIYLNKENSEQSWRDKRQHRCYRLEIQCETCNKFWRFCRGYGRILKSKWSKLERL